MIEINPQNIREVEVEIEIEKETEIEIEFEIKIERIDIEITIEIEIDMVSITKDEVLLEIEMKESIRNITQEMMKDQEAKSKLL